MPPTLTAGHAAQVRAAALTNYIPLARSLGLDGIAMLREFGIDPQVLAEPETRISAESVSRLLAESAARSGCETFGLLLSEMRSFASLGPLSLLMRHESNFRAVLKQLIGYQRLITDIIEIDLDENGEEARIIVSVTPEVATRQCVELVMGLTCRFLGGAMFGGWYPAEAHFRYPAPADTHVHQRIFRASLHFDSSFNGFMVPASALGRENAYGDPGFVEHAKNYVDLLMSELPARSVPEQVRTSIKRLLPSGLATLPRVAKQLNIHPRSLQRKLGGEGLGFADLVESVRTNLACELLANTNLPLSEVALLVGYASPGSFSRWFAGRTGQPPREWRLRNRPRAAA